LWRSRHSVAPDRGPVATTARLMRHGRADSPGDGASRGALTRGDTLWAVPAPCPVESRAPFLYLGGSPRSIGRAVRRYRGWNRPRTVQSREAPVMPMRSTSIRTAPGDCDRPGTVRAAGAPRAGLAGR
jgi:hypothetical protein